MLRLLLRRVVGLDDYSTYSSEVIDKLDEAYSIYKKLTFVMFQKKNLLALVFLMWTMKW